MATRYYFDEDSYFSGDVFVSGALLFDAGSEGAPGLAVLGDTDTGIYAPVANTLYFVMGADAKWSMGSAGLLSSLANPSGNIAISVKDNSIQFVEMTDPSNSPANTCYLYTKDNGSGKTQLVAIFPTGAVQVIATQP